MIRKDAKIYIAGHDGLVGSALMRALTHHGYTNIITKSFRELDLRRQSNTEKFFAETKPEYVLLAAAKVGGIHANNTYKAEFIYDNIMIASNVIHAAHQFGVKKLLNLGSSCIYPKLAPQPLREEYLLTAPLEPTNEPYAIAKIAAIKLCQFYNEQYGTNFISVMPTNLYGPHDNFDLETAHVLPTLIRKFYLAKMLEEENFDAIRDDFQKNHAEEKILVQALNSYGITKESVTLWGTGKPYREFLYVDDLAEACLFLMQRDNLTDKPYLNVGTGQDITIYQLGTLIKRITGFSGAIIFDETKPDGTPKKLLDVSSIHKLGWKHTIELEDGIKKAYEWYLSHKSRERSLCDRKDKAKNRFSEKSS